MAKKMTINPFGATKAPDAAAKGKDAITKILGADQGTLITAALKLAAVIVVAHRPGQPEAVNIKASYLLLAQYIDKSRGEGADMQRALDGLLE